MSVLQKKEWLCLTCQTQRLMSGGGLDEPPLPVPHPSPKHQAMGSPRHQATAAQQSPLHKPTSQQGQKPAQSQVQKPPMGTDGSGPFAPTAAKQQADTKTGTPATAPGPAPTTETQRQPKPTEEKIRTEPENQTAKESKPTPKKGEQIIPIKDLKKSRHYDVSQITSLKCCVYRVDRAAGPDQVLLFLLHFSIQLDQLALVKCHMPLLNDRVPPRARNTSDSLQLNAKFQIYVAQMLKPILKQIPSVITSLNQHYGPSCCTQGEACCCVCERQDCPVILWFGHRQIGGSISFSFCIITSLISTHLHQRLPNYCSLKRCSGIFVGALHCWRFMTYWAGAMCWWSGEGLMKAVRRAALTLTWGDTVGAGAG